MELDYRIVIPSHRRPESPKEMKEMIGGDFTVFIAEDEEEDYRPHTPDDVELITYDKQGRGISNVSQIRQLILDTFDEESIIMIDDDLDQVRCNVGQRQRRRKEPEFIRGILERGVMMAKDLDLSLYCWSRQANPMFFKGNDPCTLSSNFVAGAFIVNGRDLSFDPNLTTAEDIDLTLKSLEEDRIVFCDSRFFFDFGGTGQGEGGNQAVRTSEKVEKSHKRLNEKWGEYIKTGTKTKSRPDQEQFKTTGMSIRVDRKSDLANKR